MIECIECGIELGDIDINFCLDCEAGPFCDGCLANHECEEDDTDEDQH